MTYYSNSPSSATRLVRLLNQGIGIEVEVEQVVLFDEPLKAWDIKNDGSLRNDGKEFVTEYGMRVWQSFGAIDDLYSRMEAIRKINKALFAFGERTSIHVHFDVRQLSPQEIKSLLVVYTLFEDALFRVAGEHRKHNIFCVPLRYVAISRLGTSVIRCIQQWQKYSALNFTRARDLGTVEFRHMEGTPDRNRVKLWVLLLAHLMNYCKSTPYKHLEEEVKKLKYLSHYDIFKEKVFGPFANNLEIIPEEFDMAVSDAKLFFSLKENQ